MTDMKRIIDSISQFKVINELLRFINHFNWIFLIFFTGFILHIFYIFIIEPNDFDIKEIILNGNLILFLMAFSSSILIDDVIFGNYIQNSEDTSFAMGMLVLFIIFIYSTCGITFMLGRIYLFIQQQDELKQLLESEGIKYELKDEWILEYEFIAILNVFLLILTIAFAYVTRRISHKNDNTRW